MPLFSWMQPALLGPLVLFTFISSITPGPNNTMLAASGLNFGLRRTWPHVWGVNMGFIAMLVLIGLGMGAVFTRYPWLHPLLKYVSAAYLLFLAWKIANAAPPQQPVEGAAQSRPLTFWQAALFQWVNPKAWVMTTGMVSAYVPSGEAFWGHLGLAALIAMAVGMPCIIVWAAFGSALRRWLHRPRMIRAFNWTMAALLVLSIGLSLV
ncbi:LysE family translocator [Hylemonella sp. W303a]|uniref:LysE family translocator n=1 Tax=Hylemonella sp. W303a TaxID=3389873 RepID=UPI00396B2E07